MTIINQITSFKISGFTYNGTDTQLNYTAGVASGTAQPSKALVLDAGSNINSINTMTLTNLNTTTLTVNGTLITSGMLSNLNSIDGAIAGTGVANKVLILDSNRDITNIRNLNATTLTGTIQTSSQPNITSIGTLSSLTLAGSLSGVTTIGASGIISFTNTTASTNTTSGALIVSGGLGIAGATNIGGNLNVTGNISGTLTTASQPNITSIGTLSSLTLAGAISGVTNISANGNLTLTGHNGSTTGLILNSTLVTSTGTELNYLDLTTGPGTGEANKAIVLDSNRDITNIRNLTVTSLSATNLTGTLQTASQPNITSIGTLTSLNLSGSLSGVTTISASGVVTLTNTTDSGMSLDLGALQVSGGIAVSKNIYSGGIIAAYNGNPATSTTTGALRSYGGLGVTSAGYFGHFLATGQTARTGLTVWGTSGIQFQTGAVSYTTNSTGTLASNVFSSFARPTLAAATAGTITSEASTVYIDNSPLAGTNMTITNAYALWINAGRTILKDTTASTNSTSGALVISGGVGIGGATYISGGLSVTGNIVGTLATTNQPNITTLGGVTSIGASNSTTITGTLQTGSQTNITAVGTLTGLTSSGVVSITNTTTSSSISTGALIVSGGVGIGGAINIGGSLSLNGNVNTPLSITSATKTIGGVYSVSGLIWNTTDDRLFGMRISEADTLALCWAGGGLYSDRILFSNNLTAVGGGAGTQFNTKVYITNTTSSTNTTSGALVVLGGVGIGNNLNIGGALSVTGTITGTLATANQSNITTVGTLTGLTSSGVISITNTTSSSTTNSGALVISGGVGIGNNLNIGGTLSVIGNITGILETANQSNITSVGTLTGLTSSGVVSITNTTNSTASNNGALVISGGVGITGAINTINSISTTQSVGDGFVHNATGTNFITLKSYINTANTWAQFGTTTNHELRLMTNSTSRLNISNSGVVSITNTTSSSSTTTGALVISGGVGIAENLRIGGILSITNTTVSTGASSGALVVSGGGIGTNHIVIGSARSLASWSTSGPTFRTAPATLTDNSTSASGTISMLVANSFDTPTFAATNTNVTTTSAVNLYIKDIPNEGTNMTFTKSYALYVLGNMRMGYIGSIKNIRDWTEGVLLHGSSSTYRDVITASSSSVGAIGKIYNFERSIFSATNTNVSMSTAATIYIDGPPLAGTNMTISNPYSIYSASGIVRFADATESTNTSTGALVVGGGIGASNLSLGKSRSLSSWSISGPIFKTSTVTLTDNSTAASGTANFLVANSFDTPTFAATNTNVTTSTAINTYIRNAPSEGTNMTFTESYALYVLGNAYIGRSGTNNIRTWNMGLVLNTNGSGVTDVFTASSGTISTFGRSYHFDNTTFNATNTSVTMTNGATVYINAAPSAGTNMTITNAYSLYAAAGRVGFADTTASTSKTTGALVVSGGVGISESLYCNSLVVNSSGSTNSLVTGSNSSIRFMAHTDNVCYIQAGNASGTTGSSNDLFIGDYGRTTSTSTRKFIIKGTTGNVGIGTSAPSYSLDVVGEAHVDELLVGTSTDTTRLISALDGVTTVNSNRFITLGSANSAGNQGEFVFNYQGNNSSNNRLSLGFHSNSQVLNIFNSGNVSIGRISPVAQFDIQGSSTFISSDTNWNRVLSVTSSNASPIQFEIQTSVAPGSTSTNAAWIGTSSNNDLRIGTGNTTKMIILLDGKVGIGTNTPTSTLTVNGSLAKTSGTFDIEHPIDNTKRLVHSFIEGPRCDLIYRGSIQLINGKATIDLDKDCVEDSKNGMLSGTFIALVQNPVCYLQNSTFDRVIGTITNNLLNIVCENNTSSSIVNWMVIGERKDNGIKQWDRTDSLGRLITEYKK